MPIDRRTLSPRTQAQPPAQQAGVEPRLSPDQLWNQLCHVNTDTRALMMETKRLAGMLREGLKDSQQMRAQQADMIAGINRLIESVEAMTQAQQSSSQRLELAAQRIVDAVGK